MEWRSILEEARGPDGPVVIRGVLATVPEAYERYYARRGPARAGAGELLWRVIAWSAAGVAHLVAAFLLMAVVLDLRREEETLVWARLQRGNAGEEAKAVKAPAEPPAKPPEPEPPKPEPPKPDPAPPQPAKPDPVPAPNPVVAPSEGAPKPASVGVGASAAGAPAGEKEIEKDPTEAIRRRRAGELDRLRRGSDRDVLVVSGQYDRVQEVLDRLGIPYRTTTPDRLPNEDLSRCLVLLVNCSDSYATFAMQPASVTSLEKKIVSLEKEEREIRKMMARSQDPKTVRRLQVELLDVTSRSGDLRRQLEAAGAPARLIASVRDFVRGGGYLFTSDWGLTILEQAFPGYVRNGGNVGPKTVGIVAHAGGERHPLLEEVFPAGSASRKFRWEIDGSSYLVRVERPGEVETLVESPEVARHRAVAVAFSPQKDDGTPRAGRVLHVLSHFQKQATKQGDYALQNLLLNFLLDRVKE